MGTFSTKLSGRDREEAKFVADSNDNVAVNVINNDLKTAMDISAGLREALSLLLGTLPDPNFNEISKLVSGSTYTYSFFYRGIQQFDVVVTDPGGDFNASITNYELPYFINGDESGWLLTGDGEPLLLGDS